MPTPTFPELYDFETQFEALWKAVVEGLLTENSLVAEVATAQSPAIKDTPRIEITFQVGPPLEQRTTAGQSAPTKKQVPNAFNGVLTAKVVTTRSLDPDNASIHGTLRGLVRYAFSAGALVVNDTNLPWLEILEQLPSASTPQFYDEKDNDLTELAYSVVFAIRNTAWPSG